MILSTDFPHLKIYVDEIFNEASSSSVADVVGFKLFNILNDQRETHIEQLLHGMNNIQRVAQGQDFPGVSSVEGDTFTSTQSEYAASVTITKNMRIFEKYNQIDALVRSNVDAAFQMIDQSYGDVFGNGLAKA